MGSAPPSPEEVMGITQLIRFDRTRFGSLQGVGGLNSPMGIPFQKERLNMLGTLTVLGP